jgi:hypothetical protein
MHGQLQACQQVKVESTQLDKGSHLHATALPGELASNNAYQLLSGPSNGDMAFCDLLLCERKLQKSDILLYAALLFTGQVLSPEYASRAVAAAQAAAAAAAAAPADSKQQQQQEPDTPVASARQSEVGVTRLWCALSQQDTPVPCLFMQLQHLGEALLPCVHKLLRLILGLSADHTHVQTIHMPAALPCAAWPCRC